MSFVAMFSNVTRIVINGPENVNVRGQLDCFPFEM